MSNYKMKVAAIFIAVLLFYSAAEAQVEEAHDHHRHEVGIANSPVYFVNEGDLSYGFHLHYIYNIKETGLGIGLAYERIFDEHRHNTIAIVGSYRPVDRLSFNLSPGIAFEDRESEVNFAAHLEALYEFALGDFHIGPLLELAYDMEDYHISFGLHMGLGF